MATDDVFILNYKTDRDSAHFILIILLELELVTSYCFTQMQAEMQANV